ncbi:hypothetical protein QSH54_004715, partial [Xanthomonas arboricola pv. pruni]
MTPGTAQAVQICLYRSARTRSAGQVRFAATLEFRRACPNVFCSTQPVATRRCSGDHGSGPQPIGSDGKHNAMTQLVEQATTVRLDVWLWAARFFKTR